MEFDQRGWEDLTVVEKLEELKEEASTRRTTLGVDGVIRKELQNETDKLSRAEKVDFIIDRDLQPSDWYWNPHAWSNGYMVYLILMHKWKNR